MTEDITCWRCRHNFTPKDPFNFPYFTAYWHTCPGGAITQVCVPKEKKQWWEKTERTTEENLNHTLAEFHTNLWKESQWGK